MECFSFFFLVLLAVFFGVWLSRVSGRLKVVEAQLERLDRELAAGHRIEAAAASPAPLREPLPPEPTSPEPRPELRPEPPPEPPPPEPSPQPPPPPPAADVEPAWDAPPPGAAPAPKAPPRRIEWERWVGVRGAAVAGAAILGLAGLLFLKYSIEQGLLPPPVRIAAGLLAGLGCLVGSEGLRRRQRSYTATADALAGAGVILLYAAVWAARVLYALVGAGLAFVLMVLVTAACGALSWRYRSRVIAVLGLAGGFATPALLSTGTDRPIGLFGYLLLLDLGILVLALRRGWSFLAALSLGLTTLYQAFWIFSRMSAERALLGLAVVAVFAVLYALASRRAAVEKDGDSPAWELSRAAGVLLPFAFTFYFAGNAELGLDLYPLAALLLLLSLLAQWLGRQQGQRVFGLAAAGATVAAVLVWSTQASLDLAHQWQLVACAAVLTLAPHLFWELDLWRREAGRQAGGGPLAGLSAERVAAVGFLLLSTAVALAIPEPSPWPWLAAWTFFGALLWRQSLGPGGKALPLLASLAVGAGAGLFFLVQSRDQPMVPLLFVLIAAVACQLGALGRRDPGGRRWAEIAAAVLPLTSLVVLTAEAAQPTLAAWAFWATVLTATALAVLAATRLGTGGLYLAALAILAYHGWLWSRAQGPSTETPTVLLGLAAQAAAVVAFTAWPFLAGAAFRSERWVWYASALAGPAFFLALRRLFLLAFGDAAIGLLPVALAGLSLAATARSRHLWTDDEPRGRSRLVWFAAVTLGFVSLAIPLQLEKEWITLGWALEGWAVLVLWKRLDHPGLKYFGLFLLFAASARLVANPAVLGYYPHGGWPVLNWLLYTYLVPAAALVLAARLLAPREVARQREWEAVLYRRGWPVAAGACGLAAIAVVFVWINLAVFDFFSPGQRLLVSFDRLPARDLALSLAWIAYALLLLALGMARGIKPLRWISLAFLMLTLSKVFLYDLGELRDLYRVASLVGLAVSLLAVSLAYQRFVFGHRPADKREAAEEEA